MHHEVCGLELTHLHTTEGSLLDGFGFVSEYAERWKSHGKYLCITDHGMMAAIPSQVRECKKNDLTPIYGCELYVNSLQIQYHSEKEFKDYQKTLDPDSLKLLRKSYHLLAIAHNEVGYSNLVTLSSLAWIHGHYYRPRVNHELLMQYKEGITFTSCCYAGEIGQAFDKGGEDAGFAMIEKYMAMFGEHFYLEFMLLDFAKQRPYNQFILKAKDKYGLPIIVTTDTHYCNKEDSHNQRLMLMVQTKNTIQDIQKKIEDAGAQDLFELQDTNLWQKTEDELNEKWEKDFQDIDYDIFKEAKRTTVEICRKAGNVQLDRSMKFPQIPDANDKLREAVFEGFKSRDLPKNKTYSNRLKEEFELVFDKGFSSYFLILKATVDEARRYSMEVFGHPNVIGPGRGSCVGSLICYCLRATNVDPIQHDLLFSRFLSKARNDLPDADVDFLKSARDYLKTDWAPKYFGVDYVANIGSYNTFGIKSSFIDMAKVHGKDRHEILNLTTKLGLKDDDGDVLTWDKALEIYPELNKYCEANQDIAHASKKLINRSRSMGKHAGGIIISSEPINKYVPLVRGKEGEIVTAWTEGLHSQDLGPMGFVKYDWLVITNLEQINYACKIIKERHGLTGICNKPGQEDWSDSAFINDPASIAMANEADLKGIFQFDSDGIRNLVRKGGVNTFNDLVAYASLYRPGPMSEGMHEEYCARKKGTKEYVIHELLKPVLETTYGVICYQEQCMKILHIVGDIPLEDCEILRKAISKKKEEYFAKYKVMFIQNGMKNLGWTEEEVITLWKLLEAFAGYAFNLSHACAYTYISSMLLWLKSHYPLEFYTAILHFENDADKIKEYRLDAKRHDIVIQPLDLNKSKCKFDITDDQIYFGFANISGIGEVAAQRIVDNQPYAGFHEFLVRFGTDESVIKPLIGLKMFEKDGEPTQLYSHYKWFKDIKDKLKARDSRFKDSCKRNIETAKTFGLEVNEHTDILNLNDSREEVQALVKKHETMVGKYNEKLNTVINEHTYKLALMEGAVKPVEMDEKLVALFASPEECETKFYGFLWNHPICKSPDWEGKRTFDVFKEKGLQIGYVEIVVNAVVKQVSKKNTNYWLVKAEDENGEDAQIQVWEDDWERFKDDLKTGQFIKMEVKAPDKGFYRYTLYSPPKWMRNKLVPKTRAADMRVWVLRKPELSD
jgi:DNA polymerase-3 subunit alpha